MSNDPKPPAGYGTHLSYCLNASTSIVSVDEWKLAVAELDILREEARKYREGTMTPLRDNAMIPMMFIREDRLSEIVSDAKAYRFSCEQNSKALRHIVRDIETGRRETERTTKGMT